jgi:hypothetical protein
MANIFYSGTTLTTKFQAYNAGNVTGYNPAPTNIQSNGVDIITILSPRDNKAGNAASSTGAITSGTPGTDLTSLFNKTGATYDVTIGGTVAQKTNTPTNTVITQGVTYSGKSPTGNGVNAPTFTVPNPTVDTTSLITTTCSGAGSYSNFTIVSSQSPPNTTYYTIQSQTNTGTGALVLRLPGNYQPGTISGSFTISPVTTTITTNIFSQGARGASGNVVLPLTCVGVSPVPTVVSYSWSNVSGPTATFSNPNIQQPTISCTGAAGGTTTVVKCDITYTGGGSNGTGVIIPAPTSSMNWS